MARGLVLAAISLRDPACCVARKATAGALSKQAIAGARSFSLSDRPAVAESREPVSTLRLTGPG